MNLFTLINEITWWQNDKLPAAVAATFFLSPRLQNHSTTYGKKTSVVKNL